MPENSNKLRVAVLTPTFNRTLYLSQTLRYLRAQVVPTGYELAWFVCDDTPQINSQPWTRDDPQVHYEWLPEKLPLGAKRNRLNDAAQAWGAKILCAMDDDDWYGPDYVASMISLLEGGDLLFAGSGEIFYYHVASGKILHAPPVRSMSTCNGVLCYKADALKNSRYNETDRSAEERGFLKRNRVLQHTKVRNVYLALAHHDNTVSKRNYFLSKDCHTDLTLREFPMRPEDQAFYRQLTTDYQWIRKRRASR